MVYNVLNYLNECSKKHPQKCAVSYKDRSVSFGEMVQRAQQYGQAIRDALSDATGPHPIGVICSRDVEPIVAFIGVVYSKNFYVPMDPDAPKEKLNSIVEDSDMKIIIGSTENQALIDEIHFSGTYITPESLTDRYDEEAFYNLDIPDDYPLYMV